MPFPIPSARIVQLASVRPLENLLGKNGCCVRGRILAFEMPAAPLLRFTSWNAFPKDP